MDRPPHHDDPDDPALRQVAGERLGTEPLEPGPEARVRVERHLRLEADEVLHARGHVDLGAAQQELASQRRPAQRSSGQQPGTHAPAILAVADGRGAPSSPPTAVSCADEPPEGRGRRRSRAGRGVTGASSEIGAAMAEALSGRGAAVLVAHNDEPEKVEPLVERIRAAGGHVVPHSGDLSRIEDNERLVEHAVDELGRVDIFAANAGGPVGAVPRGRREDLGRGRRPQSQGVVLRCAGGRPPDGSTGLRRPHRVLVVRHGRLAIANLSVYAVTKAALKHMATVLALELGPHGITVNALAIGATVNQRNLADDPDYAEHWAGVIPAGRVGYPEDVADALLFLASDEAAMVTGHTLAVDGGWSRVGRTP